MDSNEEVIFEDYLYKLSEPKHGKLHLLGKSKWKQKYFQVKRVGEKPALDYFNKKPKTNSTAPKGRIWLHPSFRIEKLPNTKNRAFVFELTTPENQLCLSAEEQKAMDMFVFILQMQARLLENIKDDMILVQPENSEAMRRMGAVSTTCILHASPWGMTLALKQSRCIVAQWPIKSIRCYESSGRGLLTLEAGRVAPMGEGIYMFQTQPGDDSSMYDLLDRYIMETLDRSKITRRGTDQEIEDYLQEFDRMHTLTTIRPCKLTTPGVPRILLDNWNYTMTGVRIEPNNNPIMNGGISHHAQDSSISLSSLVSRQSTGSTSKQSPPLSSQMRQNTPTSAVSGEPRLTGRPPAPPPRPVKIPHTNGALGRPVPRPRGTNSQTPTEGYMGMTSPSPSKSFGSNPLSQKSPGIHEWDPPPSFNDALSFSSPRLRQGSDYLSPVANDTLNAETSFRSEISPRVSGLSTAGSETSYRNSDTSFKDSYTSSRSYYLSAVAGDSYHSAPASGFDQSQYDNENVNSKMTDQEVKDMKQASASCEDLSDHMKMQLYYNDGSDDEENRGNEVDENMNHDKPPMPFTRLQAFRNSADWDARDRSKSVDYYNVLRPGVLVDRSPSPSVRRIRRLMGKGNHETLRKSVSNPNFLNVASKEVHNYMKSNGYKPSSSHNSPNLERQSRSKSRSLVDLLPGAIRRHFSHENLHRSRNATPVHSRSTTPERNNSKHVRGNSFENSGKPVLNRQESAKSFEASVKNIKVTDRTRSFRKVKSIENENSTNKDSASEKLPMREFSRRKPAQVSPQEQVQRPTSHNSQHRHSDNGPLVQTVSGSSRRNQNMAYVPVHQFNPIFRNGSQSSA
ncbi:uncharacterized protein [Haliotis cracherodii]|uniref:uncharacterized protein n=1 Tax=Haliotis cracherodii TaxID=6455 RepID=UPI0039E98749